MLFEMARNALRRMTLAGVPVFFVFATIALPQSAEPQKPASEAPPAPHYANMPDEAVPYGKFTKPYKEWYVDKDTLDYFGAARGRVVEEIDKSKTVNIGFLGPLENNYEARYGQAMLHGAQMAVDEANERGGYGASGMSSGKPYALKIHNDSAQWGASSTEAVKMVFDEHVLAVLGSVDGASTHIMLRTALKIEFPIMDTGTTDPTVTETRIPWLMHTFPDDRQQGYTLADYVFKQLKLKRIGIFRTQTRYARIGVEKFFDEAKRMGRVPPLEVKFDRGDQDFSTQLRMLQNAHIEGLVIWGEAPDAARILKQMREMGMKQPVFGSSRMAYPALLEIAGSAAEGVVTTAPLDPTRTDPQWQEFRKKYLAKYNEEPDAYAAYAYDGMNILIGAIDKHGLNRGKIMDGLREYYGKPYRGAAEREEFDYTLNNIAPLALAKVEGGKFVYLPAQRREASAAHSGAGAP